MGERLGMSPLSEESEAGFEQPGLALLCMAVEAQSERNTVTASSSTDSEKRTTKGKRPWLAEEDELLQRMVEQLGPRQWTLIASKIPGRTGKQARERWLNQLNPDLRKKGWTPAEDRIILQEHAKVGNKWSAIAKMLNGRTDNSVKNRFNSTLKRMVVSAPEGSLEESPRAGRDGPLSDEAGAPPPRKRRKNVGLGSKAPKTSATK